jgi:outer membrane receptor for ferric coprogen and ferric-rhodotorulic acid
MTSAVLVLPAGLAGQAAPTPSTAAAGEVVRLNPFEVTEERDGSFQSNAVGSGSRLKLELKDVPAAYSVINREFIDALGIADLREAATWATGQTFYFADNGQGPGMNTPSQYFSRGVRTDQNGANAFGAQRNFYQNANLGGDSYAVESYDFGRGPNAALFGQSGGSGGGLAGVSSIQSKKARFDRSTTTVAAEFGQWNYHRVSIDHNRPISERLGLRINAVHSDAGGYRRFDMRSSRGLTVTGTWKATNSTDITLEGSIEKNLFHTVGGGMDEHLSGWDGSTVFRGPLTNSMISANGTAGLTSVANASYGTLQLLGGSGSGLVFGGETVGVDRIGANTFRYDLETGTVMNYQNFPITRRADSTSRVPLWSAKAPNGSFFVRGTNVSPAGARFGTDVAFGVGRSWDAKSDPGSGQAYLPADMFNRVIQNSKFRLPSRRFSYSWDMPASDQLSRDLQLTISQRVGNSLYLEIGGDINRNFQQSRNWDAPSAAGGGGRTSTLDIDQLLPNGAPNKNFLDTYSAAPLANSIAAIGDQAVRVNAAYVLDAGKWGNYTFNLNGNASQRISKARGYNVSVMANSDPRRWGNDQIRLVTYAGARLRAYNEPINGRTVQFTDVNWSDPNNPVIQAPVTKTPNWVVTSWSDTYFQSRYALLQATAKWWRDKVVFTGSYRRDLTVGITKSSFANGDLPATWDASTLYWRPDAPADFFALTYVVLNTSTGLPVTGKPIPALTRPRTPNAAGVSVRDPNYANVRFRDDYNNPKYRSYGNTKSLGIVLHATDWLSPFVNYSDQFIPSTANSFDMVGNQRLPVSAYGYDWGANLSFFKNKLSIKYNYYSNFRENDSNNNGVLAQINALYAANLFSDTDNTASGRNARGIPDLPGQDYQKRRNFGYEIEISANLAPGLRVTANGSNGSGSNDDVAPLTKKFVPDNAAIFRQLLEDAGGSLDTSQKPTGAPSAPGVAIGTPVSGNAVGIDTTNAVNAYNNIWVQYDTLLVARNIRTPRQPTMNFFADYSIQSGRAKGLRIGGGIQWQGRIVLGNRQNDTILDPANPVPTAIDDPRVDQFSLRFLPGSYLSQVNLSYPVKLANGNSLSLSLRINNAVNRLRIPVGDGNVAFGSEMRQPDGDLTKPNRVISPALPARYPEPINARLTATYSFGGGRR